MRTRKGPAFIQGEASAIGGLKAAQQRVTALLGAVHGFLGTFVASPDRLKLLIDNPESDRMTPDADPLEFAVGSLVVIWITAISVPGFSS